MNKIVIHCAETFADMDIGAAEICQWHRQRGWSQIGYHYVIRRNGDVETGRAEDKPGAHVAGHNVGSIGICLVGGKARGRENPCNFTRAQWRALESLVMQLIVEYPDAKILGHSDLDPTKSCPTFNVKAWWGDR